MYDALRDLVSIVQFKKMWKSPTEECYFQLQAKSLRLYKK